MFDKIELSLEKSDILFLGDVFLEKKVNINLPGNIVLNHEFVIRGNGDLPFPNKVNLYAKKNFFIESFPYAKKLYANLSNNHTMDFGESAFVRTLKQLEKSNIFYFGHMFNQCEKINYLDGIGFCLLGYNMSAPSETLDNKKILKLIKNDIICARSNGAKKVLVNIHFGDEHEPICNHEQIKVARKAINYGADIVIGHHPHTIQNIEFYRGKYIFYSLGNAWFPNIKAPSYYNNEGKMKRFFRLRQHSWTSESLIVVYNLKKNTIKLKKATCMKGVFKVIRDIDIKTVNKSACSHIKHIGMLRRIFSLLYSNIFVDEKFIDITAFTHKYYEKYILKDKRFSARLLNSIKKYEI